MVNAGRRKIKGALVLVCGLAVAGCANHAGAPESWWHDYEGGEIDQNRPPPPGADAPYPNYGGYPANKPSTLSATQRASDTAQLSVARNLALASAAATVLPDEQTAAAKSAAKPNAAAQPSTAPASMTTEAASASPVSSIAAAEIPATAIADIDHPPQLATAAPEPANLPDMGGASLLPGTARDFDHLQVGFVAGSALVPQTAMPGLIAYAQAHQTKTLLIQGFADKGASDAALALGWQRAQAVAAALRDAGFPAGALRLATHTPDAAPGVGAAVSLLD